jgi:hypothetical protein
MKRTNKPTMIFKKSINRIQMSYQQYPFSYLKMRISPLKGAMLTERNQSSAAGPMTIKCFVCLPEGLYILKLKIDKAMKTQSSIRPNQFGSNSYNTCIYRYKINISFLAGQ